MSHWHFDSPDPESSQAIAAELGRAIGERGLVIALVGPLGAGKTVFVKGLAEGLGVDSRLVSSPTFVIAQQYPILREARNPGPDLLYHVDLYRLESELELEEIGFDDALRPGIVVAAEWADRFPGVLGPDCLELEFEGPSAVFESDVEDDAREAGSDEERADRDLSADAPDPARRGRRVEVRARGEVAARVLEDWRVRVERADRLAGEAGAGSGTAAERSRALRATSLVAALTFWASGSAMLPEHGERRTCTVARSIETDAWGTRSVVCGSSTGGSGRPGETFAAPSGVGGLLFGRPIALDSATSPMLESLPGIGPSRARAIVEGRARAPFAELRDLERIRGIGPRTREILSRWLTVAPTGIREPESVPDHVESSGERTAGPIEGEGRRDG